MQNFVSHGDAFVFPVCKCVADVMVDVGCGVETWWRPRESGPRKRDDHYGSGRKWSIGEEREERGGGVSERVHQEEAIRRFKSRT